jgi:YVTN family beta-propeller protein
MFRGAARNTLVVLIALIAFLVSAGCGGGSSADSNGHRDRGGSVAASISGTITVGTAPSGISVDATNNKVYVANFGIPPVQSEFTTCQQTGGDLTVIDGATESTNAIPIPGAAGSLVIDPVAIALNETSHTAYVLVEGWSGLNDGRGCFQLYSQILSLDTSSLLRGIAFSLPPSEGFFLSGMAVDQSMSQIYVGYDVAVDPNVIVITGSGHSLIPVSVPPGPITVNETTSKIYVAGSSGIIVIDAASNSVIDSISDSSGTAPSAIAVNPTTNTIYVAHSQSNNLRVIDGGTDSVTGTIQVGTAPSGVAVDPQTNFIYVANAGSSQTGDAGSITVINGVTNATQTLTDLTAKNPAAVAVNPTTNKIYVANTGSNNVTVINGAHN